MTLRVLIVEDVPEHAELTSARVRDAMPDVTADVVENLEHAVSALAGCAYDLVIADLGLPDGGTAEHVLRSLRAAAGRGARVLVLSGREDMALEVTRSGLAEHFVGKGSRDEDTQIAVAIGRALGRKEERAEARQRLAQRCLSAWPEAASGRR